MSIIALPEAMDRTSVIAAIKTALQSRSDRPWSVTGGKGTAYGWITIDAPPKRRTWTHVPRPGQGACPPPGDECWMEVNSGIADRGHMSPDDRTELARLLGLDQPAHQQGVSIAAGHDYYREYIARARGAKPAKIAQPYWD